MPAGSPVQLVAQRLLQASNSDGIISVLVSASQFDAAAILDVCRHPANYGFGPRECEWLIARAPEIAQVLRAIAGEIRPDIPVQVYGQTGAAFRRQGNPARARELYLAAYHFAKSPEERASARLSLGIIEFDAGNYDKADSIWTRARQEAEQAGKPTPVLSSTINNLGNVARERKDWPKALALFDEAVGVAVQLRYPQGFVQANLNLAGAAQDSGDRTRAGAALDAIARFVEGSGTPEEATYLTLRQRQAAGAAAGAAALPAPIDELLRRHPVDTTALFVLLHHGDVPLNEWVDAILAPGGPLEAMEASEKTEVLKTFRDAARERGNPGVVAQTTVEMYDANQPPATAIPEFEDALDRLNSAYGQVAPTIAALQMQLHQALAEAYFQRRGERRDLELQTSAAHWRSCLRIFDSAPIAAIAAKTSDPTGAALTKANWHFKLGTVLNEMFVTGSERDISAAVAEFRAALDGLPNDPRAKPLQTSIRNNLGNALAYAAGVAPTRALVQRHDRRQLLDSLDLQSQALDLLDGKPEARIGTLLSMVQTYRDLCELGPEAAREYLRAARECLEAAKALLPAAGNLPELAAAAAAADAELALSDTDDVAGLERSAAGLREALGQGAKLRPEITGALYANAGRIEEKLGRNARAYRRFLTGLRALSRIYVGSEEAGPAQIAGMLGEITRRMHAWNQGGRALYFSSDPERRGLAGPWYLGAGGQWRTHEGQCLLSIRTGLDRSYAFVASPAGVAVQPYEFGPMDLLGLGAGWLQAWSDAQKPGEDASANWQAALQGVAGAIGKGLMAPVTALLPEGAEVAIMADPVVRILPLHLARVGDRPLVGPRAVKYAESVSFLRGAAAPEAREPGPIFVAAYSPPDARLLFAGIEAAGIAAARPGAKIVTGDQATPEAILKGIEASAVVHLCCHGNFVWMKPLDSTITLAGRELSLREISLRLQRSPCELIVFSACEIGARTSRSDESFANVLLDAGCQAFIGAMWKVNDLSTALLFAKFYELWNGAASGAASALSNAQMWLRERAGSELAARVRALPAANEADQSAVEQRVAELEKQQAPYAHERFWGGFCVTGSPFPLYRSPRP